jgi:hypothetical protein
MQLPIFVCLLSVAASAACGTSGGLTPAPKVSDYEQPMARRLTHDETLRWIADHRAWRAARKTKPIWARPVAPEEVGREFQTADHAVERATSDHWLCVGVADEPWFQKPDRIEAKYERAGSERRKFSFDDTAREYECFTPREGSRNWVAQIDDTGIEGFYVQPNYPTDGPLYSPAGGYVVKDYVDDPYAGDPNDVWLVQEGLFESTYETGE